MVKFPNIKQILKKIRLLKAFLIIIIFSLVMALIIISLLDVGYPPTLISPLQITSFSPSPQWQQFNISTYVLPSYFASAFKVYACQCSPYAYVFQTFEVELRRLDNNSWVEIPLLNRSSLPSSLSQFADLGYIVIDKPTLVVICGRCFFPEQNVTLPSGVSKEEFLASFLGQVRFERETTSKDMVLWILVYISLFLACLQVTRFFREEWNKRQLRENGWQNP
jgi:hypothetical protein